MADKITTTGNLQDVNANRVGNSGNTGNVSGSGNLGGSSNTPSTPNPQGRVPVEESKEQKADREAAAMVNKAPYYDPNHPANISQVQANEDAGLTTVKDNTAATSGNPVSNIVRLLKEVNVEAMKLQNGQALSDFIMHLNNATRQLDAITVVNA